MEINDQYLGQLVKGFTDEIERNRNVFLGTLQKQQKEINKYKQIEEGMVDAKYGHASHLVENVNAYTEAIHQKPSRTDFTDITKAARFVSNEDVFSVLTDGGGAFIFGCLSGYSKADDYESDLSIDGDLVNSIAEIEYGPASDLTGNVLGDKEAFGGYHVNVQNEKDNDAGYETQPIEIENGYIDTSQAFDNVEYNMNLNTEGESDE